MKRLCAVLTIVLMTTMAQSAFAQSKAMQPAAKAHFERGIKLFSEKNYAAAIAELHQAESIDPQPDVLYALGQAERLRENCTDAITYYNRVLDAAHGAEKRGDSTELQRVAATRLLISQCKRSLQAKALVPPPAPTLVPRPATPTAPKLVEQTPVPVPTTTTPPQPATVSAPLVVRTPVRESRQQHWYQDVMGGVIGGVGVASLAVGIGLTAHAGNLIAKANNSYPEYVTARDHVGEEIAGIVLLSVGGVAIATSAVRYYMVDRRLKPAHAATETHPTFSFGAGRQSGMLFLQGGF